ncbi:hypothetical protein D9613_002237 [Agrocybe pediades]|uniref:TEL2-interacting protein 1 n=1 Tax=Agrocybe pediades TaxID=84607 RepID=A0A8H4VXD4_9AGAR|nr:hypothetical protein D9613_002237 [Agrocybe pediades]
MAASGSGNESAFKRFKAVCVPLLGASRLSPASIPATSSLLSNLIELLSTCSSAQLTPDLVAYIFFPLSTILQRNSSSEIPNQILEKILVAFRFLLESWWWTCDIKIWEQIFMLCGSIIGGIEDGPSKQGSRRDDETKDAAAQCLVTLLRPRSQEEAIDTDRGLFDGDERLLLLQKNAQTSRFIPIIGQTLDSVLSTSSSSNMSLQKSSLQAANFLIDLYFPDPLIPSVLPGVVSKMTRICLGPSKGKGWTNGEIVAQSLQVMQVIITKAIGDEVCLNAGIIHRVQDLEDFARPKSSAQTPPTDNKLPYGTERTESWLRGTSSQLHIAVNTLNPLLSHPTPSALHGLAKFAAVLIGATSITLPQTQPLLLSFLLSLTLSEYPSVSDHARKELENLLTGSSTVRLSLQSTIMTNLGDNLSALPRLLSTQVDSKTSHVARLITAACRLSSQSASTTSLHVISKGIGKLLGPTGGVEKWGWSLLSVLEVVEPPIVVTHTSAGQLSLESNPETLQWIVFPDILFKNVASHETRDALKDMFHALGTAGGDACLFTVDWFMNVGNSGTTSTSVAALWCACRLLEGLSRVSLYDQSVVNSSAMEVSKRLEKHAKALARNVAELWDRVTEEVDDKSQDTELDQDFLVQHQQGLVPLHETLKIIKPTSHRKARTKQQPVVHRALSLQLIAIASGIVQARFTPLFIYVLYPVLHSLVSPMSFLSSTALAALNYITVATSYASPANLLLSNFDYVLDSVSRRLTHRWLDIEATKVLAVMIRLVGSDVVEKAGDVVEECFDRLDEFHGYGVIVDGLVEVLMEVLKVVEVEESNKVVDHESTSNSPEERGPRKASLDKFFQFLPNRHRVSSPEQDNTDYGPAPRRPWGKDVHEDEENEPEEEGFSEAGKTKGGNEPEEPPPTPIQALTKQIISRSMYFLTHDSPSIRSKILKLLTLSVPVLPESALLPSIHSAWPFILNRLGDSETYVVTAAAELVEALAKHVGSFMFRRVWDDIWPKYRTMLRNLEKGEATNALTKRRTGGASAESAYTHSHRLYRAIIRSMDFALQGVHEHEKNFWDVVMTFRRFLDAHVHSELQQAAVSLYKEAAKANPDAVWLVLTSTVETTNPVMEFMFNPSWDIKRNADTILSSLD